MTRIDVQPEVLDFGLYRGDSFAVSLIFTDQITGEPHPLTGDWKAEIRRGTHLIDTFTVDDSEEADGKLQLSLTTDQTESLAEQNASFLSWDLQQTIGSSVRTWYRGSIKIGGDVTS